MNHRNIALITHPSFLLHHPGDGHSESPERLSAILKTLKQPGHEFLTWLEAPRGNRETIARAHDKAYIDFVFSSLPSHGLQAIEINDVVSEHDGGEVTTLCPQSGVALWFAAGASSMAVDQVMGGGFKQVFVAIRPPGHHAMRHKAMGFCVFGNTAMAAHYALDAYNLSRVAIVDFDVHHGNGTQDLVMHEPCIAFASQHQLPLWPESGYPHEKTPPHILNISVPPGCSAAGWFEAFGQKILPFIHDYKPELLFVSAGFDAHKDDPKSDQGLDDADFGRMAHMLRSLADKHCQGRMISFLEGGYNIQASARSCSAYLKALAE